jgi:thioredoxin reductase (NADPH)
MEARLCRDDDVVVVGAGNSAGQAIVYLSRYARTVHVIRPGDDLGTSMSATWSIASSTSRTS